MKKIGLVLVAGGSGLRMGKEIPKQFIPIGNKSILQHTIDRFLSWNTTLEIVLVLPEDQIDYWNSLSSDTENTSYKICTGGKERFFSVKKGLEKLSQVDLVFIHDGVRPFVSDSTLNRCLNALDEHSAVIPVVGVNESVRMIEGDTSASIDRDLIRLVQTPQCFHYETLTGAYNVEFSPLFTDDASVVEKAGNKIFLVEGNQENIKITRPEDLNLASKLLQRKYD